MATASILSLLFVGSSSRPLQAPERVTFAPGFYTISEVAKRISLPGKTVRISKAIAERAAFLALKDRERGEALALVCEGLGLQADAESDGRTITIRESDKVRARERRWRVQTFEALRDRVFQAVRDAEEFRARDADERSRLLRKDEEAMEAYIHKQPSNNRTLYWVAETYVRQNSPAFRASKLSEEMPLYRGTREPLIAALRQVQPSILSGDLPLSFQPLAALGMEFNAVLDREYSGGAAWSEGRIDWCLLGWTAAMDGFSIGLKPVVNLVGNRMFELPFASQIGAGLPDSSALTAGQDLVGALFKGGSGGRAVLDQDAQVWARGLENATEAELGTESGKILDDLTLDSKTPYLSKTLADWVEKTHEDVVMEVCAPLETARYIGIQFRGRYPNWRLRRSKGALIAESPLAFWWHSNPLPTASLIHSFQLNPTSETTGPADETWLSTYFDATPAKPYVWYTVDASVSSYYSVPYTTFEAMRAPMAIWKIARKDALREIAQAPSGNWSFPFGKLSQGAFDDFLKGVRDADPTFADYYGPKFTELMQGARLEVTWMPDRRGGKTVTARLAPPKVDRDLLFFFREPAVFRVAGP